MYLHPWGPCHAGYNWSTCVSKGQGIWHMMKQTQVMHTARGVREKELLQNADWLNAYMELGAQRTLGDS